MNEEHKKFTQMVKEAAIASGKFKGKEKAINELSEIVDVFYQKGFSDGMNKCIEDTIELQKQWLSTSRESFEKAKKLVQTS